MNTIAQLCERTGADVDQVRLGVGSDRRIGQTFLFPGVGYGGSCFPKDVRALVRTLTQIGLDASIPAAVESVNEGQKRVLAEVVVSALRPRPAGPHLRALGPSLQAGHKRHARGTEPSHDPRAPGARGPGGGPPIRSPWARHGGSWATLSSAGTATTRRWRVPTRSSSTPSGSHTATPTSRGCARSSASRSSLTGATSTRPGSWGSTGSSTTR